MLKKSLFFLMRYSGLPFLFWRLFQRKAITVLMYHDIDVESFERHIKYLRKWYSIIPMSKFLNVREGEADLPKYGLVITFDDGHKRNYELLPIIKKYNIPITIFLCSGIVGTNRRFWFLNELEDFKIEQLKKVTNDERLRQLSDFGFSRTTEYEQRQALSSEEIIEMKDYVNFESHTMFHPILPNCKDENSKAEIVNSKVNLSEKYDLEIEAFAYPNGDYGNREIDYIRDSGYKAAFTTKQGFNTPKTNNYELFRLDTNDTSDMNEFVIRSSGLWEYFKDPKSLISLF